MSRGEWLRRDARGTVESALELDIRKLHRDGLRPGRRSTVTVTWSGGWGCSVVLVECVAEDCCVLAYSRDGRPVTQRVELDSTPCHYGGSRPWWQCPGCHRRCALLYPVGDGFRCRICGDLTYTTSQASRWIRSTRKSVALGRRIGVEVGSGYAVKPRGMHWRTFERLDAEYSSASRAAWGSMRPMLERWEAESRAGRDALDAYLSGRTYPRA